ncbi:MAG: DUF58 domain-containing protein [Granulosicoccus sp.]
MLMLSRFRQAAASKNKPVIGQDSKESLATQLKYEELIAQKPHRLPTALAPGTRGPDGERHGRGRAQSLSFDGVSPYQFGDDPRWVDWRATARSGELQIKRFAAQSHRSRIIILNLNSSLFFGTKHRIMAKTAALVAARLIFDAQMIDEPVGMVFCGQESVPPKRGRRQLWLLLNRIQQQFDQCAKESNLKQDKDSFDSSKILVALQDAQGMLNQGDDICLVDELVTRDAEFANWSKHAVARNFLSSYLVRDNITKQDITAGRYPARHTADERPAALSISPRGIKKARADLVKHQIQQIDNLSQLGWDVFFADELLAQSTKNPSQ